MNGKENLIMLPGPTNVPERVIRAMMKPLIYHRGPDFHSLYEDISENLGYVFQTKNDVFVLSCSGSGGAESAICNVVSEGDKVIVPVFGFFSGSLKEEVLRYGGEVAEVPIEWGDVPSAERIGHLVDVEKEVKAIVLTFTETSTGASVRDLPEIGNLCRRRDILLIVDAVSALGGENLPVDEWGIDICATGSQKCLACPPGLAMVSVSERAWEVIKKKKTIRPSYFDLAKFRESSIRKETPTTPALPLFYALDEALKMIREERLEDRFKRHARCAEAFYEAGRELKLTPYPNEKVRANTVVALKVPDRVDNAEVLKILREKFRVLIAGGIGELKKTMLRIGCMGIVSEFETLSTICALENALAEVKYPIRIGSGIEKARQIFADTNPS